MSYLGDINVTGGWVEDKVQLEKNSKSFSKWLGAIHLPMLSERHGDWEPFLERFDFGLSLNLAKSTNLTVQPCGTGHVFCWVSIFSGGSFLFRLRLMIGRAKLIR